jgi:hypothetical protein
VLAKTVVWAVLQLPYRHYRTCHVLVNLHSLDDLKLSAMKDFAIKTRVTRPDVSNKTKVKVENRFLVKNIITRKLTVIMYKTKRPKLLTILFSLISKLATLDCCRHQQCTWLGLLFTLSCESN